MVATIEQEDWAELTQILEGAHESLPLLEQPEGRTQTIEACRQALRSFHTTAAMLGLHELERAGVNLESYLDHGLAEPGDVQSVDHFGSALVTLLDLVREHSQAIETSGSPESRKTAGVPSDRPAPGAQQPGAVETTAPSCDIPAGAAGVDSSLMVLEGIVGKMGGTIVTPGDGRANGCFQLHFPLSRQTVEQVKTLLSPCDPDALLAPQLSQQDARMEKILGRITEFMGALSKGKVQKSQEILLALAEQQTQAGLYNEIGLLARDLHNSLKSFADTLDPALKDMVETKIPDSGNRLEHILELTEKAANTTLDQVEEMQRRNQQDLQHLEELGQILGSIRAVSESAQQKLSGARTLVQHLWESAGKTHADLITVLTAQDYQDLTGQVIMKIMNLLKDLEYKLVDVIRAFGMKIDGAKKVAGDGELYGPVHKGKTESLHSQDDVNALLAEFGF